MSDRRRRGRAHASVARRRARAHGLSHRPLRELRPANRLARGRARPRGIAREWYLRVASRRDAQLGAAPRRRSASPSGRASTERSARPLGGSRLPSSSPTSRAARVQIGVRVAWRRAWSRGSAGPTEVPRGSILTSSSSAAQSFSRTSSVGLARSPLSRRERYVAVRPASRASERCDRERSSLCARTCSPMCFGATSLRVGRVWREPHLSLSDRGYARRHPFGPAAFGRARATIPAIR